MSRRGIVCRALLCLACMACFGWGRSLALGLRGLSQPLVLSGLSLTGARAREMLEAESLQEPPMAFAAWGQAEGQTVCGPTLGRQAEADVLIICGPSELVHGSGAPLSAGDADGCLIDPGTAAALLGSTRPEGSPLEWNGRTLTVRGTLDSSRPLLAVQALDGDGGLDHISLQAPLGQSAGMACGAFGSRHALYGSWADAGAWTALAELASLLPVLLALGLPLVKIIRTALRSLQYPAVFLACLLAAGAVWLGGLMAAGISVRVPAELLPAKWSDFGFWGRLLEEKREELTALLSAPKTAPELSRELPALAALAAGLAASLLAAGALALVRPESGAELWLCCAACLMMSFTLSLLLGGGLARDGALWLAPPLCLCSRMAAAGLSRWAGGITGRDPP